MKTTNRTDYRREHFDNAIEYTRAIARSHLSKVERQKAKVTVAYVDLMDALHPGWRDIAVQQICEQYCREDVPIKDIAVEAHNVSMFLSLGNFVLKDTDSGSEPNNDDNVQR